MNRSKHTTWWHRLTVGQKIVCIPIFFTIILIGVTTYAILSLRDQRLNAATTNVLGAQRAHNRQYTTELVLVSQGKPSDSDAVLKKMTDRITIMIRGGVIPAVINDEDLVLDPVETVALRDLLTNQQQLLTGVERAGREFLAAEPGSENARDKFVQLLNEQSRLDDVMNRTVDTFAQMSQSRIGDIVTSLIVIGMVAVAIGLALSWWVARGIVQPLGQVVHLAEGISQGDLSGEKLETQAADEIGQLSDTFDGMLDSLKKLTEQILGVTENVNSAATQISSSAQQQATSTKQQAATLQQITSTMQEISQAGSQIIERAKQIAASAEGATQASGEGIDAVQGTSRTMEAIREQVEEVAETVLALSEKTQAISEIISTVNEVAEQSNLLALNATIEAAAAGDSGVRFSVVANEMKNLADQAKQCTVQVRTILGDIQKGINSSVMLAEEAVKRVEKGKQQTDVAEQTIRRMSNTTNDSLQAFRQIIGATNQQQIGFDQVTQGMQDIRQAALQTASGTAQLEQAVCSLSSLSKQLRTAVGNYRL